jgi:hypothetical protein
MQFGRGEPVKIGFTSNLGLRLQVIGAAHWRPLTLIYAMRGDRTREQQLHALWSAHRIGRTEWFRPDEAILKWWADASERDASLANQLERSIAIADGADLDRAYEGTNGQR